MPLSGLPDYQAGAINHSATPPRSGHAPETAGRRQSGYGQYRPTTIRLPDRPETFTPPRMGEAGLLGFAIPCPGASPGSAQGDASLGASADPTSVAVRPVTFSFQVKGGLEPATRDQATCHLQRVSRSRNVGSRRVRYACGPSPVPVRYVRQRTTGSGRLAPQ